MTENKQVLEERDKTDNDNLQSEIVVQKSEIIFSEFVFFFFNAPTLICSALKRQGSLQVSLGSGLI